MRKLFVRATSIAVAVSLVGCATRPENVIAHHVSTGRYDAYDCRRIINEAEEVDHRVRELTGTLETKANADAALVGVGLLLFWPALLALPATGGKAEEQELGRLKGEAQALQRSYKERNCGGASVQNTQTTAIGIGVTGGAASTVATTPKTSSQ